MIHSSPPGSNRHGLSHTSLLATLSSITNHNSYSKGVQQEYWKKAMQEELDALILVPVLGFAKSDTFILVSRSNICTCFHAT